MRCGPFASAVLLLSMPLLFVALPGCETETTLPDISDRERLSPKLVAFSSCEELEKTLKANLSEEMRTYLLSLEDMTKYWIYPAGPEDGGSGADTSDDGGRQEGVDYSGTNNQEAGVDEADFVKTDGYNIYVLNARQLRMLGVPAFGQLDNGTAVDIEGYPNQMLLAKETPDGPAVKAVVFSDIYAYELSADHPLSSILKVGSGDDWYYPSSTLTKLTVIDLANPAGPRVVRELYMEGSYQTGRMIAGAVHLVAYSWMEVFGLHSWPEPSPEYYLLPPDDPRAQELWRQAILTAIQENEEIIAALSLQDLVPMIYEVQGSEVITHDITSQGCTNFIAAEDSMSRGFTSILSLDVLGDDFRFDADHIVSNWSTVYASTDTLLIAEPAQDWWWYWRPAAGDNGTDNETGDAYQEATNIHRFDISTAGQARYTRSGRVDGTIINQFALSEYNDYIRVASTTGQWNRWWEQDPPPPDNQVYVLAGSDNLTVVGQVDGIAMGERIWSVRFIGERGYLVTFRNVDPLWTIDLSNPQKPAVIGELEVPGVSTYIYPLDEDHLLTIGFGGDNESLDWSINVSLFDVSDFANPAMTDGLTLVPAPGDDWSGWGWSEATYEHKAFQYWAPRKMLAVPMSTSRYTGDGDTYSYEYISKLMLVSVDTSSGLSLYGSVDHSDFYNSEADYYWCYQDIRRSIFMGDYIYAISDRGVTATDLDNMTTSASVALEGSDCGYVYVDVAEPVK